ncbi:MAG: hypothetical protein M0Z64_03280, partial [Nitrospiraceae bacterium]|nr:hypothetical protein [Nitrospiraceae bacterium]
EIGTGTFSELQNLGDMEFGKKRIPHFPNRCAYKTPFLNALRNTSGLSTFTILNSLTARMGV